jgi:uncharacterized integral membrane protein
MGEIHAEEFVMTGRMIIALMVLLLALVFALQNTEPVDLHFLRWDLSVKSGYAVGVPFVFGIFFGLLLSTRHHRKLRKMQQLPEPGSPAAMLANVNATAAKKRAASWWW